MAWGRFNAAEMQSELRKLGETQLSVEMLSNGRLEVFEELTGARDSFGNANEGVVQPETGADALIEWAHEKRQTCHHHLW